jgi:glycosyltransferase involved in cell wall biosynthesis
MSKLKVYLNTKPVDIPWGGGNNFLNSMYKQLKSYKDIEIIEDINSNYDIFFINEFSNGPKSIPRFISLKRIISLKLFGCVDPSLFNKDLRHSNKKIVVRMINIKLHAHKQGIKSIIPSLINDFKKILLANIADHIIFQSDYQKSVFEKYGYKGKKNSIIHNGSNSEFWDDIDRPLIVDNKLCFVSSTFSTRPTKRHDIIAKLSEMDNVSVIHMGNWPKNVDSKKVNLKGVLSINDMKTVYKTAHYFIHPAVNDPCPNVVFEAILSGLPVLYSNGVGSSMEIVKGNGMSLDEDNIPGTVDKCIKDYDKLIINVKNTKSYYSIERAAREYVESFKMSLINY